MGTQHDDVRRARVQKGFLGSLLLCFFCFLSTKAGEGQNDLDPKHGRLADALPLLTLLDNKRHFARARSNRCRSACTPHTTSALCLFHTHTRAQHAAHAARQPKTILDRSRALSLPLCPARAFSFGISPQVLFFGSASHKHSNGGRGGRGRRST